MLLTERQLAELVMGNIGGKITLLECGCCVQINGKRPIPTDLSSAWRFLSQVTTGEGVKLVWDRSTKAACGRKVWPFRTWYQSKKPKR
jgi:hypothetical protein